LNVQFKTDKLSFTYDMKTWPYIYAYTHMFTNNTNTHATYYTDLNNTILRDWNLESGCPDYTIACTIYGYMILGKSS
jgi:hypothetical protein